MAAAAVASIDTREHGFLSANALHVHRQILLQNDHDDSANGYGTESNKASISCSNGNAYSAMLSGYYDVTESKQKTVLHGDISFAAGSTIQLPANAEVVGDQIATDLVAKGGGVSVKTSDGSTVQASISQDGDIECNNLTANDAIIAGTAGGSYGSSNPALLVNGMAKFTSGNNFGDSSSQYQYQQMYSHVNVWDSTLACKQQSGNVTNFSVNSTGLTSNVAASLNAGLTVAGNITHNNASGTR